MQHPLQRAPHGRLQCSAAASPRHNRPPGQLRQQHGSKPRPAAARRGAPAAGGHKRGGAAASRRALERANGSSSSGSSGRQSPQQQQQQQQQQRSSSSSGVGSQQQQQAQAKAADASMYAWRQRLPGDSGWDLFKLRSRDAKTFNRFREAEVIHARWAMLGVISLLVSDLAGSPFPPKEMTLAALAPWGVVGLLSLALIESYRLAALWDEEDFEKRAYPGKRFDILGFTRPKTAAAPGSASRPGEPGSYQQQQLPGVGVFAPWLGGLPGWLAGGWWFEQREMTQVQLQDMKARELRNGRLAMVSFVGCCMASALTGKGPLTLLAEHLADPVHHTIMQTLQ